MAKPYPSLTSDNRKGGLEEGQTSRNHEGSILWTVTIQNEPTVTPAREEPIDASKKRYGTGPVYGSILEFAGGSVVQNAEMVASSVVAYNKNKEPCSTPRKPSPGQEKRTRRLTWCILLLILSLLSQIVSKVA